MIDIAFSSKRIGLAFALLLMLVCLVYSNTYNASWHMDDYPNITSNKRLHLNAFNHGSVLKTFFANPDGRRQDSLYRPVACLTFALNWYFGKDNVAGYHLVNTIVHFLTAFFLYLTVLALFKTPNLKNRYRRSEQFIALLAATLWAAHPIQIQAVTYIVQRMASMAAMFYLLGIFCYVKGRLISLPQYRGLLFAGCITSYFLALGCKENTTVFPLALLLVEVVFFQDPTQPETSRKLFWCAIGGVFFVVLTGALFFMKGQVFAFLKGYAARPFTIWERLLTEPRVLVLYLTQIFCPLPDRFSIGHEISVSTSLLKPWTTLPAILLICNIIGLGLSQIKKRPLVAFAVLFFFLNHLIESTILPLELVFEHRNYLPSLFLFLPLSAVVKKITDRYQKRCRIVYKGVTLLTAFLITGLGISTYTRNSVWASEKTLWEDVKKKSPGIARPYEVLAAYHKEKGEYDIALQLYRKALKLSSQMPKRSQALCLNNIGNIYFNKGEYRQAIEFFNKALEVNPGYEKSLHNITLAYIKSRDLEMAKKYADRLNSKYFHENYLNLKAFVLIKQARPIDAIPFLVKALQISPFDRNAMVNLGAAFTLAGKYKEADNLFEKIHQIYPKDMTALLYLIENTSRVGNDTKTAVYIRKLLAAFTVGDIKSSLVRHAVDSPETLYPPLLSIKAVADELYQLALDEKH
jgi:tetratricopeptide (TPR) repeat protein